MAPLAPLNPPLAAGFCPKNLAFARIIMALPEPVGLQPLSPQARTPMNTPNFRTTTPLTFSPDNFLPPIAHRCVEGCFYSAFS